MTTTTLIRYGMRAAAGIALITLSNGCCTSSVIFNANQAETRAFNPTAVYQSTNDSGIVLEGTYAGRPPKFEESHGYIVLSLTNSAPHSIWTNAYASLDEIGRFP